MNQTKVFLLQEAILNYRIPVYNALAKETGIDFALVTCVLSNRMISEAFKETGQQRNFKTFIIPSLSESPFRYLIALVVLFIRARPNVVITGLGHRVQYSLAILKHLFGFKLILWSGGVPYRDKDRVAKYAHTINAKKLGFPTFRTFLQHCNGFVLYSDHAKTFFKEYFSIPEDKMFVAPNSPDTNLYWNIKEHVAEDVSVLTIKQRYSPNGEKILLTLGRLSKDRRLDLLLKAYKKISEEYPLVSFIVIGDGPERTAMENLSREMHLKNVFFVGEIYDDTELAKYFACAYIYTGIASMAFKIAMTMGVPIVGFDYGLEVHAVKDGVTGYIVTCNNYESLAKKIIFLLNNKDIQKLFSATSEKIIRENINLNSMVKGFVNVIKN